MKLRIIFHKIMFTLPVVSCILFIILFAKAKYTISKLDSAIGRYNKNLKIASYLLSTSSDSLKMKATFIKSPNQDTLNHRKEIANDTAANTVSINKNTSNDTGRKKAAPTDKNNREKPDTAVSNNKPEFADFKGQYENEIIINRSDKFIRMNLNLLYRFIADSNFSSIPPLKGTLEITEETRVGRKTTHELRCPLTSVQYIGSNQVVFIFREPVRRDKGTSDVDPIRNQLPRKFTFTAAVFKNKISGILSWEDLADDMMSYFTLKKAMELYIRLK